MTKHLSFKEYLESKDQLLEAVANVPKSIVVYEVYKYCTLDLQDELDERSPITLKPKHTLVVEWSYANPLVPAPESIKVEGVPDVDEDTQFSTNWTSMKLQKWLIRHTQKKSVRT